MIIKSLFISLFVIKFLMYLPMVFTTLEIIKNTNTHTKYMTRLIIQQLVDIKKKMSDYFATFYFHLFMS